jgi:hypothetical protein
MPMLSLKNFAWSRAAHASDAVDAMFGAFRDLYNARHNSALRLAAGASRRSFRSDDSTTPVFVLRCYQGGAPQCKLISVDAMMPTAQPDRAHLR